MSSATPAGADFETMNRVMFLYVTPSILYHVFMYGAAAGTGTYIRPAVCGGSLRTSVDGSSGVDRAWIDA